MCRFLALLFIFPVCAHSQEISIDQFLQGLSDGESFNLLDAREQEEYQVSHLKGAVHIGYKNFNLKSTLAKIDKNKKTVVYCSLGYRSGKIVKKLLQKKVKAINLNEGIFTWVNKGLKVYAEGEEVSRVHGHSKKWSKHIKSGEVVLPKKKNDWFWF